MVSSLMKILGIETTCDETGASVVEGDPKSSLGLKVLSNVVASSFDLQKKYGGVVPEVAAREQVRVIIPVINEALENAAEVGGWKLETGRGNGKLDKESNIQLQNPDSHLFRLISKIGAIAVAYGPGLIGSLLIGVETAKTLALAWNKPLIGVNHLIGHLYANWLEGTTDYKLRTTAADSRQPTVDFPAVALIVSGGHTDLILMKGHGKFRFLGGTRDDAAGEAFDKVARILGLPYPGGPEIEKLALKYNFKQNKFNLPKPMVSGNNSDFSFSGIKTAVSNLSKKSPLTSLDREEIAYKFQDAVCEVLVKKTLQAALKYRVKTIIVGGGVAANKALREKMQEAGEKQKINTRFPSIEFSIDNGAMVAACAYYLTKKVSPLFLNADPSLHL